jgi:hypothetical protein
MKDSDAILAYQATSAIEAHALVACLANAGIDARVLGESLQGGYAGLDLGGMNLPEVWVAGKDRELAAPIISAWQAEHHVAVTKVKIKPRRFKVMALLVMCFILLLLYGIG